MNTCPRCGNAVAPGRKFCNKCGAAIPAASGPAAAVPPPPAGQPTAEPKPKRARREGLSLLWLIVPTAVFAVLRVVASEQRNIVQTLLVVAAAGGLYWWKQQPLPANASPMLTRLRPFTYALQVGIVFVMLGGVIAGFALAIVGGFILFVARNPLRMVHIFEPWWQLQDKMPMGVRRILAFGVPGAIGWYIGTNAGGVEWGATLLSLSIGVTVAFLFLFTPPASMRQKRA